MTKVCIINPTSMMNLRFGATFPSLSYVCNASYLLSGVLATYWAPLSSCAYFSDFLLLYVSIPTRFVKIIIRQIFKRSIISGNKISIVPEAILHLVCAVCGILPLIIFHEDGDLYQLFLQIVLFPMVCYIVSTICILILKSHSAIVFSTLILFSLFYR